jgi:hypothetical protein
VQGLDLNQRPSGYEPEAQALMIISLQKKSRIAQSFFGLAVGRAFQSVAEQF